MHKLYNSSPSEQGDSSFDSKGKQLFKTANQEAPLKVTIHASQNSSHNIIKCTHIKS